MTQILQEAVSKFQPERKIRGIEPVGGGSINQCARILTNDGDLFAKWNARRRFPGMFEAEQRGLEILAVQSSFRIPVVFGVHHTETDSVLLMEFLTSGPQPAGFWEVFGRLLAEMHRQSSNSMGLDHHNYIGSLNQLNTAANDWNTFFVQQRLRPQLASAVRSGLLSRKDEALFDRLSVHLDDFFPAEPPALLHGDLWSGNYLCTAQGQASIFDPAVYFGHRLMDIGMTKLFGGFGERMYQAYHASYPLNGNWEEGIEVANLYPLLVHVNLFGASYVSQVRSILLRYA